MEYNKLIIEIEILKIEIKIQKKNQPSLIFVWLYNKYLKILLYKFSPRILFIYLLDLCSFI